MSDLPSGMIIGWGCKYCTDLDAFLYSNPQEYHSFRWFYLDFSIFWGVTKKTPTGWWYTYLPLWKIWKSVGVTIPSIWKKHVPNHQPAYISQLPAKRSFTVHLLGKQLVSWDRLHRNQHLWHRTPRRRLTRQQRDRAEPQTGEEFDRWTEQLWPASKVAWVHRFLGSSQAS